jgi:anti-anti-sigma factor
MSTQQHVSDDCATMPMSTPGLRWRIDRGVVMVAGEVDASTADEFGAVLAVCNGDMTVAAVDLSRVTFFSAAGVRAFVRRGWTTGGHPMIIASPAVRRVLTLCEVEFLLERHGWTGGSECSTRVA